MEDGTYVLQITPKLQGSYIVSIKLKQANASEHIEQSPFELTVMPKKKRRVAIHADASPLQAVDYGTKRLQNFYRTYINYVQIINNNVKQEDNYSDHTKTAFSHWWYETEGKYPIFPPSISLLKSNSEFFVNVKKIEKAVIDEFKKDCFAQLKRDALYWRLTLQYPGNVMRGNIMRRFFIVLKYGGLLFKPQLENHDYSPYLQSDAFKTLSSIANYTANKSNASIDTEIPDTLSAEAKAHAASWKMYSETNYPLATVLSHGGRVLIQLGRSEGEKDHSFWKWLLTGDPNGDLKGVVSCLASGDEAEASLYPLLHVLIILLAGKLVFKRLGGTHGIEYKDDAKSVVLPFGRRKCVKETNPIGTQNNFVLIIARYFP